MKGHKQIDSINDIKDFVSSYPEFKKMSGTVNKHVALLSELSKEVKENRLMEISECEQTLACGPDKDKTRYKNFSEVLEDQPPIESLLLGIYQKMGDKV